MGQTYQSTVIDAPVERVWDAIRDFHNMSWAPNVVTGVDPVGKSSGNEVGARRVLNDAFHETLLELNDAERTFRYSIDDAPSPASKADMSNYVVRVQVRPAADAGGAFVELSSAWQGNNEATGEFFQGIYAALLADMKKSLESTASV